MAREGKRPGAGARPARLPGEERREHFLEVATDLISEHGVDAVTMEGVAAAAGVSKGLGYAYFANRGDLLLAVLDREVRGLGDRVSAAMGAEKTFEDRVRAGVHAWLDAVAERGGLLTTLLNAGQIQKPLQKSRNRMYRRLEEFYGDLAVAEFGIPRVQAVAASAILMAGLGGVLDRWRFAGDDRQMLEDTYVRVTVGALQSLRDPPPG